MRTIIPALLLLSQVAWSSVQMSVQPDGIFMYDGYWPTADTDPIQDASNPLTITSAGAAMDTNTLWVDNVSYTNGSVHHPPDAYIFSNPSNMYDDSTNTLNAVNSYNGWLTLVGGHPQYFSDNTNAATRMISESSWKLDVAEIGFSETTVNILATDGSLSNTQVVTVYGQPDDIFPAPSTNGVPAVSLAWMDAFDPPVSNYTPVADTPEVAEWTREADSGDTIALTGEEL